MQRKTEKTIDPIYLSVREQIKARRFDNRDKIIEGQEEESFIREIEQFENLADVDFWLRWAEDIKITNPKTITFRAIRNIRKAAKNRKETIRKDVTADFLERIKKCINRDELELLKLEAWGRSFTLEPSDSLLMIGECDEAMSAFPEIEDPRRAENAGKIIRGQEQASFIREIENCSFAADINFWLKWAEEHESTKKLTHIFKIRRSASRRKEKIPYEIIEKILAEISSSGSEEEVELYRKKANNFKFDGEIGFLYFCDIDDACNLKIDELKGDPRT